MITEKYKLLLNISDLFLKNGFNKVSMDSLAKELRVSKKTIYKHFSSKVEIVEEINEGVKLNLNRKLKKVVGQNVNSVDKLFLVGKVILDFVEKVSKKWHDDLRQNNQKLWNEFENFRIEKTNNTFTEILKQGSEEDLVMNISSNVFSGITYGGLKELRDRRYVSENDFSFKEASKEFLKIIIRGILTAKGKEEFGKIRF